jgi:hypothetical protein
MYVLDANNQQLKTEETSVYYPNRKINRGYTFNTHQDYFKNMERKENSDFYLKLKNPAKFFRMKHELMDPNYRDVKYRYRL